MYLKSYLLIATCGLGILATASIGFSCLFTRRYGQPKRSLPQALPADFDLPFEAVSFTSHSRTIEGWFIPPAGNPVKWPTIIVVHGWSFNKSSMLPVAKYLHQAGFGVLAFDARGHGSSCSDGPITILKFAEDIISAVQYLEGRHDVDISRLGVVGHSMGGASGILAASMDPRIRALVSTSAFADPVSLTRRYMKRYHIPPQLFLWCVSRCIEGWLGSSMEKVAPYRRISDVHAPVLLIHGDSDRFIPPSDMEAILHEANDQTVKSWLAAGRRHTDVILDPEFGPRIISFLQQHLAPGKLEAPENNRSEAQELQS
jgi:dipeptidyl aminopeptidase/acylaminoacyl peptidase